MTCRGVTERTATQRVEQRKVGQVAAFAVHDTLLLFNVVVFVYGRNATTPGGNPLCLLLIPPRTRNIGGLHVLRHRHCEADGAPEVIHVDVV